MILASIPFAWIYLLPTQIIDYAASVLASLFFGSNFYWLISLQQYGAESSLLKPFLHTWSLAIEEQYYIIYPLILIAIYRWAKHHTIALLFVGLLLSLQFSEFATLKDTSFSFYMLPSRFWELLSGGLLANILYFHPREDNDDLLNRTMPIFGLFLIVHSMVFIDINSNHPGFITLIPIIGTILIIWFANENDLVTKILSSKLFVGIGLISYSLYLWHFPIFAFGRIVITSPSVIDKFLWILLAFVLSVITYHFVEKPYRKRQIISLKNLIVTLIAATIFICTFSFYVIFNDGVRERLTNLIAIYGENEFDNEILRSESWGILKSLSKTHNLKRSTADTPSGFEKSVLWYSNSNENKKVLIIGNSHSKDLFNAVYQNSVKFKGIEFARFGMRGSIQNEQVQQLVSSLNFIKSDIILISFRYNLNQLDKLSNLIKILEKYNKKIYMVSNTSEFHDKEKLPLFDWYIQKNAGVFSTKELKKLYFDNMDKDVLNMNEKLKELAHQHSVTYLDRQEIVCDFIKGECDGVTPKGFKSFYDYGHWTLQGAKHFGHKIAESNWLNL